MHGARWQLVLCSCAWLLGAQPGLAQDPRESRQLAAPPPPGVAAEAPTAATTPPQAAPTEAVSTPAQDTVAAEATGTPDEELIMDPELAGSPASEPSSLANTASSGRAPLEAANVRLVLHTRAARDLRQEDAREEVWMSTTVAALDASLRRSESLGFSLGILARYQVAALAHNVPDAKSRRYEFDAIPTSGYVDATVANGWHVRAGYQPVQLGRFDVFSATNVLAVHDLRDGFAKLPEVPEIGQLALLSDIDVASWLSVRAIYVPFFTPHIIPVNESRYALFESRQSDIDATLDSLNTILSEPQLRSLLANNLSRADRARIASSGLATFTPEPTVRDPQAALRATAHGTAGELALTLSTALEHLPAFRISDALLQALAPSSGSTPAAADARPFRVEYNRFAVIAMDGALDAGPLSVGFELAYMLHRTLYAVGNGAEPGSLYAVPIPNTTDMLQLGARVEYAQSAHWLCALEAFGTYTVSLPKDPQRAWMFLEGQRYYYGAGGVVGYTTEFRLHLELAGAVLSGATFIATPRISYGLLDNLDVELGALFVEGNQPPMMLSSANLSIGGLLDGADHVFIGVRYAP